MARLSRQLCKNAALSAVVINVMAAAIASEECGTPLALSPVDISRTDSGHALLAAFRGVGAAALVDHGVDV